MEDMRVGIAAKLDLFMLRILDRALRSTGQGMADIYRAAILQSIRRNRFKRAKVSEGTEVDDIQQLLVGLWIVLSGLSVVLGIFICRTNLRSIYSALLSALISTCPFTMWFIRGVIDSVRFKAHPGDRWSGSIKLRDATFIGCGAAFAAGLIWFYDSISSVS